MQFGTSLIGFAVGVLFPVLVAAQQPRCSYTMIEWTASQLLGETVKGDFNGDQNVDLAIVAYEVDSLLIFANNGDGSFAAPTSFPIHVDGESITTGDLDGDLDLDIVIGNSFANSISVLLNDGTGSFGPASDFPVDQDPNLQTNKLQLIDVDNDGNLDAAVTSTQADEKLEEVVGSLAILINDGTGSFGAANTQPVGINPSGMLVMEFEDDGDQDLLVATAGATEADRPALLFMANDGAGNFSVQTEFESFQGGNVVIQTADVDADSSEDIVLTGGSSNVSIFYGSPQGYQEESFNHFNGLAIDYEMLDLDGDSDLDFLIASGTFDRIGILLNNGNRTFSHLLFASLGLDAREILQADFDGDGTTEVVVIHEESMSIATAWFDCEIAKTNCVLQQALANELENPRATVVEDFNGDLLPDLATTFGEEGLAIQLNQGDGTLAPPVIYPTDSTPDKIVAADIDDDFDIDLITENSSSLTVSVMKNDGDGLFVDRTDVPVPFFAFSSSMDLDLADLDNDGDLDLVVSVASLIEDSYCVIYLNDNGDFVFESFPTLQGFLTQGACADIDNDLDVDLIFNNVFSDPAELVVLLNNGDATFSAPTNIPTGGLPTSPGEGSGSGVFAVGDVNGDANMDLVVADRASDNLSTILGFGDGTFADPVLSQMAVNQSAIDLKLLDLDQDNDLDVAIANGFSTNVMFAMNDGQGNYELEFSAFLGQSSATISAADMNFDGNDELFVANRESNSVVVANIICSSVLLGDINLDGAVNLLDVTPFVELIVSGEFQAEGDINADGDVNLLDVQGFVELLAG